MSSHHTPSDFGIISRRHRRQQSVVDETRECDDDDGLWIVGGVGTAVSGVWHQLGRKGRSRRVARCKEGSHFSRRSSESGRASGECGVFVPRARRCRRGDDDEGVDDGVPTGVVFRRQQIWRWSPRRRSGCRLHVRGDEASDSSAGGDARTFGRPSGGARRTFVGRRRRRIRLTVRELTVRELTEFAEVAVLILHLYVPHTLLYFYEEEEEEEEEDDDDISKRFSLFVLPPPPLVVTVFSLLIY